MGSRSCGGRGGGGEGGIAWAAHRGGGCCCCGRGCCGWLGAPSSVRARLPRPPSAPHLADALGRLLLRLELLAELLKQHGLGRPEALLGRVDV